jgi:sugar lactone lactonase YvrE
MSPDGARVFFSVSFDPQFLGRIYSVPRIDHPTAEQLELFHTYVDEIPDGIAFGRSSLLYVALKKPGLGVSILRPDGSEKARLGNTTDPLFPYDAPANIAFNHRGSIVVTNHAAFTGRPESFGVLDVFVDDKESPLLKPLVP